MQRTIMQMEKQINSSHTEIMEVQRMQQNTKLDCERELNDMRNETRRWETNYRSIKEENQRQIGR